MKPGEIEAKLILEHLGISFDSSYYDCNPGHSMADLKTTDGRYIEVTHTTHNKQIVIDGNEFSKMSVSERISIMEDAHAAYIRLQQKDYEKDSKGELTHTALSQCKKDVKLIESHYGIASNGESTEFKCDLPVIEHSVDNILHEIVEDKGKKYTDGKTDLFIFVTEDEYRNFTQLLSEKGWNGSFSSFAKSVAKSRFDKIYICRWKFEDKQQRYITEKSTLIKIEKHSDESIEFACVQY